MKHVARMVRLGAVLGAAVFQLALAAEVSPVEKVVSMLTDMKAKGAQAVEDEKRQFAEYGKWVSERVANLGFEIKKAKSDIERLQATGAKEENKIVKLTAGITDLDSQIAQLEGDLKASKNQRDVEHSEYLKAEADYSESIDALQRAIQILKAQSYDRPQAQSLLQKLAVSVPGMQRVLAAIAEEEDSKMTGAPEVAAYEFQSDGLVSVLQELLVKFKTELENLEKQESNMAHAFNMAALHGSNTVDNMKLDREEKAQLKGRAVEAAGIAKAQLAATSADLAEDQKLLSDTQTTFAAKQAAFENNQKVRAEELQAIDKAIEIISSPEVAESYGKHVKLLQVSTRRLLPHAPSLLQERSQHASIRAVAKTRAAAILRSKAQVLASKLLAQVATEVAENPFTKVIGMIEDMLAKLKSEAEAEATHKAWCDTELASNKLRREKNAADVNRHQAAVELLGSQIQTMAEELSVLAQEQLDLAKAMSEATSARQAEKAKNEAAIADAVAAQRAVKQAVAVLKEFYAKQSLLQVRKQVPEMAAYKGLQGAKGGVVGMLEVIDSDFARLETDTRAAEAQAAAEYTRFMADAESSTKQKHEREFKLKLDKDQAEFEQSQVKKDLAFSESELSSANAYFADLQPACVQVQVSYEDRVARRQEEIEALKEAYKVLDQINT